MASIAAICSGVISNGWPVVNSRVRKDDRRLITGAAGRVNDVILVVDGVTRLENHIVTRLGQRFGWCGGPRRRATDDVGRALDQCPAEATRVDGKEGRARMTVGEDFAARAGR